MTNTLYQFLWHEDAREFAAKKGGTVSPHVDAATGKITGYLVSYNADYNAAINIGSCFLASPLIRQATDDLAQARDEPPREIVGGEPRSPHPFMGGS
mgnify:CR=1 FL=1